MGRDSLLSYGLINVVSEVFTWCLVLDNMRGKAHGVFADASHAVHDDAKDRSGAVERLGTANVYASSTKRKVVRSSFEAKENSLHEVMPQVRRTRRFMVA